MTTIEEFRKQALAFPNTTEQPHFERTSFRVKKKIFATLDVNSEIATLKFSEESQSLYCKMDSSAIYPVPNKWGTHGWTLVELKKVSKQLMQDMLESAFQEVQKSKSK